DPLVVVPPQDEPKERRSDTRVPRCAARHTAGEDRPELWVEQVVPAFPFGGVNTGTGPRPSRTDRGPCVAIRPMSQRVHAVPALWSIGCSSQTVQYRDHAKVEVHLPRGDVLCQVP